MLNYNGLKYLKETIRPILGLDYPNYEFIIVDNASTDRSIDYIKKFSEIKLIKNKVNLGYSKGKNIGIKMAKGKFVLCLDEDILIKNRKILINLIKFYNNLNNPCFINVLLVDKEDLNKKIILSKQYGSYYNMFGIINNKKYPINKIQSLNKAIETVISFGGNMFFLRENWFKLGELDESQLFNLDDDDISTRARVYGYKNYLYNKDYFIHLGFSRRASNKQFRFKYRYYFSGKAKPIVKNFQVNTIIYMLPLFFLITVLKTIKQALFRLDVLLIFSFFESIFMFIKHLPSTIKKRNIIQSKRIVNDNTFLNIRSPKFD